MKHDQRGVTLLEALVVMAILAITSGIVSAYGLGWMQRERQRSVAYEIFVHLNVARVEAVTRNRRCRFILDSSTQSLQVLDLHDPANTTDDVEISAIDLGEALQLGTPDGGNAVTFNALGPKRFEVTFNDDGTVVTGVGAARLNTGDTFRRVSVFAGGAISVDRWNGTAWTQGS